MVYKEKCFLLNCANTVEVYVGMWNE